MGDGWNKGPAARLSKQQEQFRSSFMSNMDNDMGWGDTESSVDPTKVGWGKRGNVPPPDLSSKPNAKSQPVRNGWDHVGDHAPKTNGWGSAVGSKNQKPAKQPATSGWGAPADRSSGPAAQSQTERVPSGWGPPAETNDRKPLDQPRTSGWGTSSEKRDQNPTAQPRTSGWGTPAEKKDQKSPDQPRTSGWGTPAEKKDQKPPDQPRSSGWGAPPQAKDERPARQPEDNAQKVTPGTVAPASKNSHPSPPAKATQPPPTKSTAGCDRTKPLTNGLLNPTRPCQRVAKTEGTLTKATPNGSVQNRGVVAKQIPRSVGAATPANNGGASVRPKTNVTARTRDLYVPPGAKLAAAAATSTSSGALRTEKGATHKETPIKPPTRATNINTRSTNLTVQSVKPKLPERAVPDPPEVKEQSTTTHRKDMFIIAGSERERFQELVLLLEDHPLRRPALLIVDRSRTDPLLLKSLLCLAGHPTSPTLNHGSSEAATIRIICTDELNASVGKASVVINVDMFDSFDELGDRRKYLEKNGLMKTLLVPAKDALRAANLASTFQDCGLPVPQQLEKFLCEEDN